MNRNIDKVTSTKTWATTVIERQSREKDKKWMDVVGANHRAVSVDKDYTWQGMGWRSQNSWSDYISLEAVPSSEWKKREGSETISDATATLSIRDWVRNKEFTKNTNESVELRESLKRGRINYYTKILILCEKDSWKKSH